MKIIKEIEKNRLTDESLNKIQGGENCTQQAYIVCTPDGIHTYDVTVCMTKIDCPNRYIYCTGSEPSGKFVCPSGYWQYPCVHNLT